MTNDSKTTSGKTDFSKFKISNNGASLPVAQKVITHVPVSKPGKQTHSSIGQCKLMGQR